MCVRMCPEPILRSAPVAPVAEAEDEAPEEEDEAAEAEVIRVAAEDFNEDVIMFPKTRCNRGQG